MTCGPFALALLDRLERAEKALADAQVSLDPARESMWAEFYAAEIDASLSAVREKYEASLICDCGSGCCVDPANCAVDRLRTLTKDTSND